MSDDSASRALAVNRYVGRQLAALRRSQRISPVVLARRLGVPLADYQRWESGQARLPPDVMAYCAEELGVYVTYFFSGRSTHASREDDQLVDGSVIVPFPAAPQR